MLLNWWQSVTSERKSNSRRVEGLVTMLLSQLSQHLDDELVVLHPSSSQHMLYYCPKSGSDFSTTHDLVMSSYCGHCSHHDPPQLLPFCLVHFLQNLTAKETGRCRDVIND